MPNWCDNTITIEGPADKIRALWEASNSKQGLLEAMVPIGEWDYHEAVAAWGTKWDISLENLQFEENDNGTASIYGQADSAWGPPLEAFQSYSNDNEDVYLELKYFESGMAFIGVWDSEGGDAYWDEVNTLLDTTAEDDAVLAELIEDFGVRECYAKDDLEEDIED